MLGDTININNLCYNLAVLKKSWWSLLKIVFWTQVAQKWGHYGPHPQWKIFFLAEITKADHLLSESFYFIKISYVLTEFWICSILSGVFCQVWLDLTLINQSINQNKYISLPNNKNTSIVTTVLQWISIYTAAINYHINLKSCSVHLYNSTI